MKITFPHMGNLYISLKVLFDILGIDYYIPHPARKNLEQGIVNSPEFACLPFKVILGDVLEGIREGADHVLFGGGCGQCRFGYYANLHETIMKSIGCDFRMIRLDSSNMTFEEFKNKFKPFIAGKSVLRIANAVVCAANTVLMLDRLNRQAAYTRCRELECGRTDRIIQSFHQNVLNVNRYEEVKQLIKNTVKELKSLQLDYKCRPLRVIIAGEIYTCIDPFVNMDIESLLGRLGVEVYNRLTISSWIIEHGLKKLIPLKLKNIAHEAGKEFFKTDDIGGHGLQTAGNAILAARDGFDGVIHLYPFTCMPEIVAQCSFGEIQKKYGIPIMTLVIDELTGKAGYETRIEAFVDMLERRRQATLDGTFEEAF